MPLLIERAGYLDSFLGGECVRVIGLSEKIYDLHFTLQWKRIFQAGDVKWIHTVIPKLSKCCKCKGEIQL